MIWVYHNMFILSPVDGHLGSFQSQAIMNRAAVNVLTGPLMKKIWISVYIHVVTQK